MAKNDQIEVWMNGKRTSMKRGKSKMSQQEAITEDEHAATMDNQPYENHDTLQLPEKKEQKGKDDMSSNGSRRKWKPFVIAIISAVCIGGIFGLIMLKVVGTLGDYGDSPTGASGIPGDTDEENNDTSANDNEKGSTYTLPNLKAYVIQGGVFEKESSVNDWKTSFKDAAFSPIIWQADDGYYLFVGIAQTKEQGEEFAKSIKETYGMDVFSKEWRTNEAELNLDEDEQDWMDSVINLWNESLEDIAQESGISIDEWQDLVKNVPPDMGDELKSFHDELSQLISDLDKPSDNEEASFILQVWHTMENELIH